MQSFTESGSADGVFIRLADLEEAARMLRLLGHEVDVTRDTAANAFKVTLEFQGIHGAMVINPNDSRVVAMEQVFQVALAAMRHTLSVALERYQPFINGHTPEAFKAEREMWLAERQGLPSPGHNLAELFKTRVTSVDLRTDAITFGPR